MDDPSKGAWRRSRKCADTSCVEIKRSANGVAVRSSQEPEIELRFTADQWRDFVGGVKRGEFDRRG